MNEKVSFYLWNAKQKEIKKRLQNLLEIIAKEEFGGRLELPPFVKKTKLEKRPETTLEGHTIEWHDKERGVWELYNYQYIDLGDVTEQHVAMMEEVFCPLVEEPDPWKKMKEDVEVSRGYLKTIKGIMVFFTVLWTIGVIVGLIIALVI